MIVNNNSASSLINSISDVKPNKQTRTDKTCVSTSLQLSGQKLGIRSFEQSMLTRLREVVHDAAAMLDVYDLNSFDTSPEATSKRIADFAIGMYSVYKNQNPDMDDPESLEEYEKLIRGAVDKGFLEAMNILSGINALTEDVLEDIDKTYELIHRRFDDFFDLAKHSSR